MPRDADGPGANPPADLASLPDAEPRVEPIRPGGPNKPYQVLGREYVPATRDVPFSERGLASWYGRKFHGRRTASGEVYDMYAMTAAHPTLPIPSYARIRNPANGREVLVRVNDRGPFVAGRIVDLSYAAAFKLDLLRGVAPVELERITFDEIRTGAWRGGGDARRRRAARLRRRRRGAARPRPIAADASRRRSPCAPSTAGAGARRSTLPAAGRRLRRRRRPSRRAGAVAAASTRGAGPAARPPKRRAASGSSSARSASATAPRASAAASAPTTKPSWLEPLLAIFGDASLYRVQAGPYPSRDDADGAAQRARSALGVVPIVVERR